MRDARLDNIAGSPAFDRRRHEAYLAADQYAEADQIVAGLAKWCCETLFGNYVIDTSNYAYGLSALATPLSATFPEHAFHSVSDAARRQSLEAAFRALIEQRDHAQRDIIAILFGRALGHALGHVVDKSLSSIAEPLPTLWRLAWSDDLLGHSYVESLRQLLRSSSAARSSVLAVLEIRIKEINKDPAVGVSLTERDEFRAIVDDWRLHPAIDRLWQYRFGRFRDDLLDLTADLLPAARRPVLALIDRFDFPHPIQHFLLRTTIWHDRDEIAAILEHAPPCSNDGRSWNHRLLAMLALRAVDNHCDALWRAAHQKADSDGAAAQPIDTVKDVLKPWIEQLAQSIMGRSDGRFLAAQWLFTKVSDERMNRPREGHPEQAGYGPLPRQELIEWVAQGLSNAGLSANAIGEMVSFPDVPINGKLPPGRLVAHHRDIPTPRFGALVAMCLLDQADPKTQDPGEPDRLDQLDGVLICRDSALEIEATVYLSSQDLPASCFGYLLADAPEPATRWRQSWDLLVEQRRRLQHWSKTMDSDALAPSLFLLSVGTSGLAWLLSTPHRCADKARTLWRQLFEQSRECWLTMSLSHMAESTERHIHRLFCWHPLVFGDSTMPEGDSEPNMTCSANEYSELLAQDLDYLGGDDLMVTICCLHAHRNGASSATMSNVIEHNSGRIRRLIRQYQRWHKIAGEAHERSDITSELSQLMARIRRSS